MDIQDYFELKKTLYSDFLDLLENEQYYEENILSFIQKLSTYQIKNDKEEMTHFIRMIACVSTNIHRFPKLLNKIMKILENIKEDLQKTFSNAEIFNIFESSKLILLYLFENKILAFDEYIYQSIEYKQNYYNFFLPEIKEFKASEQQNTEEIEDQIKKYDNYFEKRRIGENESYICSLIREDNVEDFVAYMNRSNYNLSSQIDNSIFETNCFLEGKKFSLIEYSAFFGSIQIFQYLRMNNVRLTPSLWLFVIHSDNADLIHLLEDNKVSFPNNSSEICLIEAIKCHHNEIAQYIINNLTLKRNKQLVLDQNIVENCFRYCNYFFFPDDFSKRRYIFELMSRYNYEKAVNLYMDEKWNDIQTIVVNKAFYFLMKLKILIQIKFIFRIKFNFKLFIFKLCFKKIIDIYEIS